MAVERCVPEIFLGYGYQKMNCTPVEGVEGNGTYITDALGNDACVAKREEAEPIKPLDKNDIDVPKLHNNKNINVLRGMRFNDSVNDEIANGGLFDFLRKK